MCRLCMLKTAGGTNEGAPNEWSEALGSGVPGFVLGAGLPTLA